MKSAYACGQLLYCEWNNAIHRKIAPYEMVSITKVGRRWLELSNGYRADAVSLYVDGGGYTSPGRCFLSREAREAERARDAAWTALRNKMSYAAPATVSAEDIARAAQLLGL